MKPPFDLNKGLCCALSAQSHEQLPLCLMFSFAIEGTYQHLPFSILLWVCEATSGLKLPRLMLAW